MDYHLKCLFRFIDCYCKYYLLCLASWDSVWPFIEFIGLLLPVYLMIPECRWLYRKLFWSRGWSRVRWDNACFEEHPYIVSDISPPLPARFPRTGWTLRNEGLASHSVSVQSGEKTGSRNKITNCLLVPVLITTTDPKIRNHQQGATCGMQSYTIYLNKIPACQNINLPVF